MNRQARAAKVALLCGALLAGPRTGHAEALDYGCTTPPLEVTFAVAGGHYDGAVHCGNLFLQPDIPTAPVVRWKGARPGRLYLLLMLDLDGNANGSWPDHVPPGENSPVRHWIVGNIPAEMLRGAGYREGEKAAGSGSPSVLQPYRAPQIPMVSDRYGAYLFEQDGPLRLAAVPDPVTNFDYAAFLDRYRLRRLVAANFFVVAYTSASPFSGKAFHGNDVSGTWHRGLDTGTLAPSPEPPGRARDR